MNGIQIGHLSDQQRRVIRPVALAYRRAYRAKMHEHDCYLAALAEYRRLVPNAPADDRAISATVIQIVAAAINANTDWFWHGPDA